MSRCNRSVSLNVLQGCTWYFKVVSFLSLLSGSLDSSCLKTSRGRPLQCLRDELAPFSTSLMFHQPLSCTQYGNCKAWRFAIIKHIFNDPPGLGAHGASQPAKHSLRLFCPPAYIPSQLRSEAFCCALISQSNLCLLIFQGEKREDVVCSPPWDTDFLAITWRFVYKRTNRQVFTWWPWKHTSLTIMYYFLSSLDYSLTGFNKSSITHVFCLPYFHPQD